MNCKTKIGLRKKGEMVLDLFRWWMTRDLGQERRKRNG